MLVISHVLRYVLTVGTNGKIVLLSHGVYSLLERNQLC
jgi:hypothetical protein